MCLYVYMNILAGYLYCVKYVTYVAYWLSYISYTFIKSNHSSPVFRRAFLFVVLYQDFTTFIHEFLKRSRNWRLNLKIAKIIKNTLKNSLNVKFLRKRAVLLTFWLFCCLHVRGVNFLKAKVEFIIERNKTIKRKFYIIHICKNRFSLCLEQSFQPKPVGSWKYYQLWNFSVKSWIFQHFRNSRPLHVRGIKNQPFYRGFVKVMQEISDLVFFQPLHMKE